jgi:hypothetical protein
MEKPSATLLLVWRAILRRMDDRDLSLLRQRLWVLGEDHPDFLSAIDVEVRHRAGAPFDRRATPRLTPSQTGGLARKPRSPTPVERLRPQIPGRPSHMAPHPHE